MVPVKWELETFPLKELPVLVTDEIVKLLREEFNIVSEDKSVWEKKLTGPLYTKSVNALLSKVSASSSN